MPLSIVFDRKKKTIMSHDQSTSDALASGHFGITKKLITELRPEEALYLLDSRNAICTDTKGMQVGFDDLASDLDKGNLISRYFTYKSWRDRGLVARYPEDKIKKPAKPKHPKLYPASKHNSKMPSITGTFFSGGMTSIVADQTKGKKIYENDWMGQYGTYKTQNHGKMNKLDIYETTYLLDKKALKLSNANRNEVIRCAKSRRKDFPKLYDVYRDWRGKGYIVKTGFKFGTHFRVYFPGAKPMQEGGTWVHSKHVIHVFPRDTKLITSEWARAIRVAHSVRKTFILAIPGKSRTKRVGIDFVLYHRENGETESPATSTPRYAMLSIGEDEYLGGAELSAVIRSAKQIGLDLVIAISDRETAVTYYKVRRIRLEGSTYEYYEIDWMQP